MNIFNTLESHSDNIAVITEKMQMSYTDLLDTADMLGEQVGKRSLIFAVCGNSAESIAGYVGFMRAGSVVVLIQDMINDSLFEDLIKAYRPEYLYLPEKRSVLKSGSAKVFSFGDYTLFKTGFQIDYSLHDDLALLLTTSGSTGSPKFVKQSYKNIANNAEAITLYLEITNTERAITTMPMVYTYQLSILNSHFLKGGSIIVTDSTLLEKGFWKIAKDKNATTFGGVPFIYEMLNKLRFDEMNLPSLKYITQAGGQLNRELSVKFADICAKKGIKFYMMYGQTEATARMSYLPWEHASRKAGSIGIPIPGGRFWIEDEEGNIVKEDNTPGELVYQGENVTMGYAENRFDLAKGDENKGVLRTGDVVRRDADGFYYVVGRKKRFLKMFGNRINLDEVEQILKKKGYDCVCSGRDDDLKIYVTKEADAEEIKSYIAGKTGINRAGFSVLRVDSFPRNRSGKVLYAALNRE